MKRFSFLLILLVLVQACSWFNEPKIVRTSIISSPFSLDPAVSSDTVSASILFQSLEPLYEYEYLKRPYTLKPLLAERLPMITNRGLTYTFKIKRGITYHSDPCFKNQKREVVAQDFINQFKRVAFAPTKSTGWWLLKGRIKGLDEFRSLARDDMSNFFSLQVEGLEALDDNTLRINLTKPYPLLLNILTMVYFAPVPEEALTYYNNDLSRRIIGTGPFIVDTWVKDKSLTMVKNSEYRNEIYPQIGDRDADSTGLLKDRGQKIPFVDGIHFTIINQYDDAWKMLLQDQMDLAIISLQKFPSVVTNSGTLSKEYLKDGYKFASSPTLTQWWLSFNLKEPVYGKNKNLRMAIAHAVNVEDMIKRFTVNTALKANSIFPPTLDGSEPTDRLPYYYDLKLARDYLKKAGYPDGKGLPPLVFDTRGENAPDTFIAQVIQKYLAEINIPVKIRVNSHAEFYRKSAAGELSFWLGGWTYDYPDAESILHLLSSKNIDLGQNPNNFVHAGFDALLDEIITMPPSENRTEKINEMEAIVNEEMPWIVLYYERMFWMTSKRLNNFRPSDLIYNYYKYLRID